MTVPVQFPVLQQRGLAKYIKLALDFTMSGSLLDPRITFSRASNATVVGSDGLIQYAPHNLLTYSENFDNSVWDKGVSVTIVTNSIAAPDGTSTADTIVPAGSVNQGIYQVATVTASTVYTVSVYAKLGTMSVSNYKIAIYNATAGAFIAIDIIPAAVVSSNEWTRIDYTFTTPVGCVSIRFYPFRNSAGITGTVYLWGAQLNIGSLQPYYTTSVKNLLGYSQDFENAAWAKVRSSVSSNVIVAPDGTMTADSLNDDGAAVGQGYVSQSVVAYTGSTYTFSFYAKAKELTSVRCYMTDSVGIVSASNATVDLVTGSVISGAATVTDAGNGWFRISVSGIPTAGAGSVRILLPTDTATTNGIYLYGAQLSDSASLDPYSYNFGAAPTSTDYYGPRFDYDPVTLAPKGLLIEEQRTNSALDSNTFNLSLGTTETLNAAISPDGTQNASLITETTSNSEHYSLDRGIAVTLGNTYVWSFYAKQGAGSARKAYCRVATAATASVMFDLVTGSGFVASSTNLVTYGSQQLSNGWWRCFVVFTAASTATAICRAQLATGSNSAIYTGDGVSGIYLWGAQLEAGAFPTSYIPTTSAAVTRAADNASMTGTNFSSWYNQSEGTFSVNIDSGNTANAVDTSGSARGALFVSDGTTNNRYRIGALITTYVVTSGGVLSAQISAGTLTANTNYKLASTYAVNSYQFANNGLLATEDTSGALPIGVNQMQLGISGSSAGYLNGHIQSIKYYPRRLANGDLQAITS